MKVGLVHEQAGTITGPATYARGLSLGLRTGSAEVHWLGALPSTGGFDVVHVVDMKQLVTRGETLDRCPYPVVLDLHDDYWTGRSPYPAVDGVLRGLRRRSLASGYLRLLDQARHVIVHSDHIAHSVPHHRVSTVPLPLEAAVPVEGDSWKDAVLFVGRDSLRKGLPVLGHALRLLQDREEPLTLHVVGHEFLHLRPMQRWWLRGLTAHNHQGVNAAEMKPLWREVSLVVLPSYDEAYGLVPLEALYRGIPVVVTDVGGLGPWVRRSGGGMVVPPNDPSALADAVIRVKNDYGLWKQRALKARETLIRVHDPGNVWSHIEEVYKQIS